MPTLIYSSKRLAGRGDGEGVRLHVSHAEQRAIVELLGADDRLQGRHLAPLRRLAQAGGPSCELRPLLDALEFTGLMYVVFP